MTSGGLLAAISGTVPQRERRKIENRDGDGASSVRMQETTKGSESIITQHCRVQAVPGDGLFSHQQKVIPQ
jgi:hypothetical protein